MKEVLIFMLLVVAMILLVIFAPMFTIAALNTLFALNIPYTLGTWFAIVWLNIATFGGLAMKIGNK